MRTKNWLAALAIIAVVAVVAWALFLRSPPRPQEQGPHLSKVRVAQTGDFLLYAGLYVAKDAGIFNANGLHVEIVSTGGDEKSAAAVLSGQAEIGVGDPTFAAIANARGQDLKFFANVVNGVPFWGITFRPEVARQYEKTGLRGLKVATFPAPSTAFALQTKMFKDAGLPARIQEGAFGSLTGLLQARQAEIALELEPNVSLAQKRGATVLYSLAEANGDFAITGAVARRAYIQTNTREVKAYCRSIDQAFALIRATPDRAVQLLQTRFSDVPKDVIASAMRRVVAEGVIPSSTAVSEDAWAKALALRRSVGDLPEGQPVSASVDTRVCAGREG